MGQAQKKTTLDQVLKLVDQLAPEERGRLYQHLQFRFWDEHSNRVRKQLDEQRVAQGLPSVTDEELEQALDALRTPAEFEALKREIQAGIEQADKGELIDGNQLLQELRQRAENRLKKS